VKIPIKNLFYLLCYALDFDKDQELINNKSALNFDTVEGELNLLAYILKVYTSRLIKRGLDKGYKDISEELSGIRGKINIGETIKKSGFIKLKLTCDFEELKHSILHNQIIKTTLNNLSKTSNLDKKLKEEIIDLKHRMGEVKPITLDEKIFFKVRFHSNIKNYRIPIKICEYIFNHNIPNQETGKFDFIKMNDEELAKIFEKFVLNFYKRHLKDGIKRVSASRIKWQSIDWLETKEENRNLPELWTDTCIYNKELKSKLIIDAKFYKSTVSKTQTRFFVKKDLQKEPINTENINSNAKTEKYKFLRDNIFQLFAYLKNFEIEGKEEGLKISGMLLYALSDVPLSTTFMMHGHKVKIQTIDLNKEPEDIKNQMFEQIKTFDEIPINA